MKIKRVIAVALSLFMAGGAFTFNAPHVRDYSITADAAGECYTFNSTTGQLTLKGNVVLDEITGFTQKDAVKSIRAAEGTVFPENCQTMFNGYISCTSINLSNVDTSIVTNMARMFQDCIELTSLDLSSFDTSSVIYMNGMFYDCKALTSPDLSSFDTRSVCNMSFMFYGCKALTSLDLSSFETSNVMNMQYMFCNCSSLTSLDLSSFDTSNVNYMSYMFWSCSGLTALDLSSFDTSSVENADAMLEGCTSLSTLTLGKDFGDIAEGHKLPNGTGWVNTSDTSTIISGSGEYAAIQNTGKNTYVWKIPMQGDVNCDGEITVADAVLLQKWLLAVPNTHLPYWQNADLCADEMLNVFDLCLLKRLLVENATYTIRLEDAGAKPTSVAFIIHQYLGCSLAEAKDRVAAAPVNITNSATKADVDQLTADLELVGATISVTLN